MSVCVHLCVCVYIYVGSLIIVCLLKIKEIMTLVNKKYEQEY